MSELAAIYLLESAQGNGIGSAFLTAGIERLPGVKEIQVNVEKRNTIGMNFYCVLDRKSTRLNSSHVAISYAVFCLKKKKKRKRHHSTSRTKCETDSTRAFE